MCRRVSGAGSARTEVVTALALRGGQFSVRNAAIGLTCDACQAGIAEAATVTASSRCVLAFARLARHALTPHLAGMPVRGRSRLTWRALGLALVAIGASGAGAQSLVNRYVRATFGPHGLTGITDVTGRRTFRLADGFSIALDDTVLASASLPVPRRETAGGIVRYRWHAGSHDLTLEYELRPEWHFVSKRLLVSTTGNARFHVRDIAVIAAHLEEQPSGDFVPGSARPVLQTADYGIALRFADAHGLLVVAQNPFLHVTRNASDLNVSYAPDMDWDAAWGDFASDRALIAPVRLTGHRIPATMIPEWRMAPTDTPPGLDDAEVAAFTSMVRAFLVYEPARPINVFVGWTANDYQIDVGTPTGRAEYKRLLDRAAEVGAQYVLYAPSNSALSRREESVDDWSWEHVLWLGLGQKIRRAEWDPASSPVPASVQEMLEYARTKDLRLLAYVYPVMPFAQDTTWLVPGRNPQRRNASLGSRALAGLADR